MSHLIKINAVCKFSYFRRWYLKELRPTGTYVFLSFSQRGNRFCDFLFAVVGNEALSTGCLLLKNLLLGTHKGMS